MLLNEVHKSWKNCADAPHDVITFFFGLLSVLVQWSILVIQPWSIPLPPPTLSLLLDRMPPIQLAFIDKLNSELSKVDSFFIKRETDARARSLRLKEQLGELKDHRRLFHVTDPPSSSFCSAKLFENRMLTRGLTITLRRPFLRPIT